MSRCGAHGSQGQEREGEMTDDVREDGENERDAESWVASGEYCDRRHGWREKGR